MNTNKSQTEYLYLDQILIETIIFDESEFVTLFAFIFNAQTGKLGKCSFVLEFGLLTDMPICLESEGEPLINGICKIIQNSVETPSIITVTEITGKLLKADLFFKVYKQYDNDFVLSDCFYVIESFETLKNLLI
jgi:hypothetical protein